jgi:hypothetical protein
MPVLSAQSADLSAYPREWVECDLTAVAALLLATTAMGEEPANWRDDLEASFTDTKAPDPEHRRRLR